MGSSHVVLTRLFFFLGVYSALLLGFEKMTSNLGQRVRLAVQRAKVRFRLQKARVAHTGNCVSGIGCRCAAKLRVDPACYATSDFEAERARQMVGAWGGHVRVA